MEIKIFDEEVPERSQKVQVPYNGRVVVTSSYPYFYIAFNVEYGKVTRVTCPREEIEKAVDSFIQLI